VTVFKDGQFVSSDAVAEMDQARLVANMVGRNMNELFPPKAGGVDRPIVLVAKDISVRGRVYGASIELRSGEISALAGMVGAGRTELAMALFGGLPMAGGQVTLDGVSYTRITPAQAIALGIGFLTEDRKGQGLAMLQDVATNITASDLKSVSSSGWLDRGKELEIAKSEVETYRIACRGPQGPVLTMSGGNQQKVLVSRWARTSRRVIIMDEPTRGVDVGAKAEIYRIMRQLADSGLAVLMISSDMPEVIGLADRVFVMCEGVITGELRGEAIDEHGIIRLATLARAS
jgi:ABC-type sugar transport system ATPase subunit